MGLHEEKIEGVPQFVSYFAPIIQIMRDLEGQATPRQVFDELIKRYEISEEFLSLTNKNGGSKFENRVHFARFYLFKAGLMYSPRRGLWGLTDAGWNLTLTPENSAQIFRSAQTKFGGDEDEENAPAEEIVPEGVNYWFVGAKWSAADQTDRFLAEGIWQNGYDKKFSNLVRKMKPGDRIAIKSSFVCKRGLPFENHNRSVSAMRIKAIGTILSNLEDGRTVKVEWQLLNPPRDWYFYTYRTTVSRARLEDDDMARQLVTFTFEGKDQDYQGFLAHPYWAERFSQEERPISVLDADGEAPDEEGADELTNIESYGISDVITDGCFLNFKTLQTLKETLESKKNLILQGAPGTGKTWIAKRLAFALIGSRNPIAGQLRAVQFHPSLSYEDFVRGYRPSSTGLVLTDGIFLQIAEAARAQPDLPHVLIIEEINRGNPAQIFGEMLTLLENTKRSRADAIELAYRRNHDEKIHLPDNLYVIGTMNIADRSLALVDLALRRRFAFAMLEPLFNESWERWLCERGLPSQFVDLVRQKMNALNTEIAQDRALGSQFRVGHSFVTPPEDQQISDGKEWFLSVINSEIGPLLEEYWFDSPIRAQTAVQELCSGI